MEEYLEETKRWIDVHLFLVLAGLSAFVILFLLSIFLCLCIKCKGRQTDESCEPLHYPSSTLQYIRFNQVIKPPSSTVPVVKI